MNNDVSVVDRCCSGPRCRWRWSCAFPLDLVGKISAVKTGAQSAEKATISSGVEGSEIDFYLKKLMSQILDCLAPPPSAAWLVVEYADGGRSRTLSKRWFYR